MHPRLSLRDGSWKIRSTPFTGSNETGRGRVNRSPTSNAWFSSGNVTNTSLETAVFVDRVLERLVMDMRDPVDVEIFADEIDANVAARAFNWAYLSGARSAVVARDPRGWVVRVYQYAPVGYLAPKTEAAV